MPPFVIFSLPRSRSAWLSRFLTYGDWICGHEELRHMRSLEDVEVWFEQPCIGTAETAAAPWWRLLDRFAAGAKVLVVRRPVDQVVDSLMRLPGVTFDRTQLHAVISQHDRKLNQIEARVPNVLSVDFDDLVDEQTCAAVFEHCLPYKHDPAHWARLAPINIQINMPALMRYAQAYRPAMLKLAAVAKHQTLAAMAVHRPIESDAITFETVDFNTWQREGERLFRDHCVVVGESPDNWQNKNIPLMKCLDDVGALQIMTAWSNGRMLGYLMTIMAPSLTSENLQSATNTTFYVSPDAPNLGMKLQRAALQALKKKGIGEVFFEAGSRGSGPRLPVLYKRLGAQDHGHVYRMELTGV